MSYGIWCDCPDWRLVFGAGVAMARAWAMLAGHLTTEELRARYRGCRDAQEGRRWHALWL